MKFHNSSPGESFDLYYRYIKDINRYQLLTPKQERQLLIQSQAGNKKALDRLVCSNLKFVINVSFLYRNQGFSLTELINEGNIGLIEAAKRFDTTKKIRFISYAVWWIRQSITRAISEKSRVVRISAEKELLLRRLAKTPTRMVPVIGGGIKIDSKDLGEKLGFSQEQVEKILEMGQGHSSLDESLDENSGNNLLDVLSDKKTESAESIVQNKSVNGFIHKVLDNLSTVEQKIIKMYFGIGYHKPMSLEDIGDLVGLSKERVRQIKEKGLGQLRCMEWPDEFSQAA